MDELDDLRLVASIELFNQGKLSSGAAAELAKIPKPLFLSKLGGYGVPVFQLTEEELRRDLENASGITSVSPLQPSE